MYICIEKSVFFCFFFSIFYQRGISSDFSREEFPLILAERSPGPKASGHGSGLAAAWRQPPGRGLFTS